MVFQLDLESFSPLILFPVVGDNGHWVMMDARQLPSIGQLQALKHCPNSVLQGQTTGQTQGWLLEEHLPARHLPKEHVCEGRTRHCEPCYQSLSWMWSFCRNASLGLNANGFLLAPNLGREQHFVERQTLAAWMPSRGLQMTLEMLYEKQPMLCPRPRQPRSMQCRPGHSTNSYWGQLELGERYHRWVVHGLILLQSELLPLPMHLFLDERQEGHERTLRANQWRWQSAKTGPEPASKMEAIPSQHLIVASTKSELERLATAIYFAVDCCCRIELPVLQIRWGRLSALATDRAFEESLGDSRKWILPWMHDAKIHQVGTVIHQSQVSILPLGLVVGSAGASRGCYRS